MLEIALFLVFLGFMMSYYADKWIPEVVTEQNFK